MIGGDGKDMHFVSGGHISPHLKRWMLFTDGENLTLRAQALAADGRFLLKEGHWYRKDTFVWIPNHEARTLLTNDNAGLQFRAIRSHYYTSAVGDDDRLATVNEMLRSLGFEPRVFKRDKGQGKSKGVDISMATDILCHAFLGNYDAAVLVAGDGDYLPLVEQVKRLGKIVYLAFFEFSGLSLELRRACGYFYPLEPTFSRAWKGA